MWLGHHLSYGEGPAALNVPWGRAADGEPLRVPVAEVYMHMPCITASFKDDCVSPAQKESNTIGAAHDKWHALVLKARCRKEQSFGKSQNHLLCATTVSFPSSFLLPECSPAFLFLTPLKTLPMRLYTRSLPAWVNCLPTPWPFRMLVKHGKLLHPQHA